ncbi:hypothetical protein Q673_02845 [Marinobacter sp. EN3]|jgi:hypothetical protein|uniref:hypothetical protein n=1 Tax=Marinobacter sp. EN3 TaxID=1397533 RepID=UPI0003B9066A|nr:hypothetical protein [Marinobacter sp. EN3]ERS12566.1 hypothetical protein Q673_02845 [Marinobacter sp. EN3]
MSSEVKGGFLARNAALLCQDSQFRLYLDRRRAAKFNLDIPDGTHTEEDAREFILQACGIQSRAQLDHSPQAATVYRQIRYHYQRWQDRQSRRDPLSR